MHIFLWIINIYLLDSNGKSKYSKIFLSDINYSHNKFMKFNYNINLPQKSIFGFKVLSSVQSSIACYILLIIGKILNPFFGFSQIQIISGSLFNIVLNLSFLILLINLIIKRKQIQKIYFIFLNFLLLLYLPFSLYDIWQQIKNLLFY